MKKVLLLITVLFISFSGFSQKKNAKVTFEVDGVCMMCKKRIEKAALNIKGVKFANWNVKTHQLMVIMDERKTNVKAVKQKMAAVGHDTKEIKASDEAYDNLHPCCKYRDEEVKKDHQKEKS